MPCDTFKVFLLYNTSVFLQVWAECTQEHWKAHWYTHVQQSQEPPGPRPLLHEILSAVICWDGQVNCHSLTLTTCLNKGKCAPPSNYSSIRGFALCPQPACLSGLSRWGFCRPECVLACISGVTSRLSETKDVIGDRFLQQTLKIYKNNVFYVDGRQICISKMWREHGRLWAKWFIWKFSWLWQTLYNLQPMDALSHVVRGQEASLWHWSTCFSCMNTSPMLGRRVGRI